jgi:hypothetical protein
MKQLLSALVACTALIAFSAPAFAQSAMAGPTKAPAMASPSSMPHMSMSHMTNMKPMTVKCPAGQTLVKGYTKKDGTKVAAYCRKKAAM